MSWVKCDECNEEFINPYDEEREVKECFLCLDKRVNDIVINCYTISLTFQEGSFTYVKCGIDVIFNVTYNGEEINVIYHIYDYDITCEKKFSDDKYLQHYLLSYIHDESFNNNILNFYEEKFHSKQYSF